MIEINKKITALEAEVQKQRKVNYMLIGTVIVINITNCFLVIKFCRLLELMNQIIDLVYPLIQLIK